MKQRFLLMSFISLLAMLGFVISNVNATSGIAAYYVGSGETYEVALDGQLKTITNNTAHTIFIPSRTLTEQQSFLNNIPSGVLVITTPTCSMSSVTKTYGDANFTMSSTTNSDGAKTFSTSASTVAGIINSSTGEVNVAGLGTATITLNIAAHANYKATSCTATVTVSKGTQAAPEAPTMASNTETSIVLNACSGGGCEYRRDSGTWQTSTTFSGLTMETSYSFTQRKAETTNYNASPASSASSISVCAGSTFLDTRNNQEYPLVQIGNQCWMQKNLNYATGTSYCYDNNTENCTTYGRLYDWNTATSACPSGWKLPTDAELHILENYLSTGSCSPSRNNSHGCDPAGAALRSGGYSGFNALMSGFHTADGSVYGVGDNTSFWSSSEGGFGAWYRGLHASSSLVFRNTRWKDYGFSVRCLKN